jgi:hypothetical protein
MKLSSSSFVIVFFKYMKSHYATSYSINFVFNENCFNKFVFMNQLINVLILLMMIINRLKFVVSFFLSMLFLFCEWSKHCRTMCLTFCLIQSQKHVDETMFNIFLLKKYSINFIRFVRICVVKLLSNFVNFSCSFNLLTMILFVNVKQKIRECFV